MRDQFYCDAKRAVVKERDPPGKPKYNGRGNKILYQCWTCPIRGCGWSTVCTWWTMKAKAEHVKAFHPEEDPAMFSLLRKATAQIVRIEPGMDCIWKCHVPNCNHGILRADVMQYAD